MAKTTKRQKAVIHLKLDGQDVSIKLEGSKKDLVKLMAVSILEQNEIVDFMFEGMLMILIAHAEEHHGGDLRELLKEAHKQMSSVRKQKGKVVN